MEREYSEYNIDCTAGDDYALMFPKLKNSIIKDYQVFNYNWLWIEDFTKTKDPSEQDDKLNLKGLDLDQERKVDMLFTTVAAAFNHYTYAILQKC